MSFLHQKQAIRTLHIGGIVAYPTEAVYGLGCLPKYSTTVYRILQIKHRPIRKGLILVAADSMQLADYVNYPNAEIKQQIQNSWPGPITWLLPAKKRVPAWITGEHSTVAVRVSAHPIVRALCEEAGILVSTSANISGFTPATDSAKVRNYFKNKIDYILPGIAGTLGKPTEIRDACSGKIIRSSASGN